MSWALTSKGTGKPVGARRVREDFALQPGEWKVSDDEYDPEDGKVLDVDGRTLRDPTSEELAAISERPKQPIPQASGTTIDELRSEFNVLLTELKNQGLIASDL